MRYFAEIGIPEDSAAVKEFGLEGVLSRIEALLRVEFSSGGLYWDSGCTCLDTSPQKREYAGKKYTVHMAKATEYVEKLGVSDKFYEKFSAKMRKDLDELFGKEAGLTPMRLWAQTTC
jgi:hypothetical protein